MAVGMLAPKEPAFPRPASSHGEIQERLEHWRQMLKAHDEGVSNCVLSRREILASLDKWLDEALDLKGR